MKTKTTILVTFVLLILVLLASFANEYFWSVKDNQPDNIRHLVGLPSIVVGNLSPATRNPGLEVFCSGLNDVPGGYCNYFTGGAPFTNVTEITGTRVTRP